MVNDALQYVSLKGWKYKRTSKEIVLHECPYCHAKDYKFNINAETGVWLCNHANSCGERGNLRKLQYDMGDLTPVYTKPRKKPKQIKFKAVKKDFYGWLSKNRGIDTPTLEKYSVELYTQPDGKRYIVYQFVDEHGELLNRKYRNVKDKSDMRTERDAALIYYGLQYVDFSKDCLIVVEGEDDCHALSQIGIENVVSIPQGAMCYSPEMDEVNKKFKTIIIAMDNDEKGQSGARRFAEKAGLHKCINVMLPYKDARECIINGMDFFTIQRYFQQGKRFKCEMILDSSDLWGMWYDETYNQTKRASINIQISGINRILGGIRKGELTIISGHSGQGKSTFAYNFGHWAEKAGMNVFSMSFENKIVKVAEKFFEIDTGNKVWGYNEFTNKYERLMTKELAESLKSSFTSRRIWHFDKDFSKTGFFDVKIVVQAIEYANKFYDCDFVIVDHLHYFLRLSVERNPHDKIAECIRELSILAQKINMHIALIVHPHKPNDRNGKLEKLTMNSGKGSSAIVQEADNYILVGREGDTNISIVEIVKNRENGRLGKVAFEAKDNGNTYIEKHNYNFTNEFERGF